MTEATTRALALAEFTSALERRDGRVFPKGTPPAWVTDAIRACHETPGGLILPDDWIYEQIASVLSDLESRDPDDWEDQAGEIADSLVDCYSADRTKWLASHLARVAYVTQACEEYGRREDLIDQIGLGQYAELSHITHTVIRAIFDRADDLADPAVDSEV